MQVVASSDMAAEFAGQFTHPVLAVAEHPVVLYCVLGHAVHVCGRYESPGQNLLDVHVVHTPAREYFPAGHAAGLTGQAHLFSLPANIPGRSVMRKQYADMQIPTVSVLTQ